MDANHALERAAWCDEQGFAEYAAWYRAMASGNRAEEHRCYVRVQAWNVLYAERYGRDPWAGIPPEQWPEVEAEVARMREVKP